MTTLLHQLRFEQKIFWRSREAAVFVFIFPLLLYALLGSVYGDLIDGVPAEDVLLAGLFGYGAANIAFGGLAITLVLRRESGVLKRLRSTPLAPSAYLVAVLLSTLVTFALESLALLLLGGLAFGASMPANVLGFVGAILLGVACFAGLGVGAAALIRSAEGVSAAVNVVILPMAFLSGSFGPTNEFPAVLQAIADVLPLTYFLDITYGVYLAGDSFFADPTALARRLRVGHRRRTSSPGAASAGCRASASGCSAARGSTGAERPPRARRRRTSTRRRSGGLNAAGLVGSDEPEVVQLLLRSPRRVELDRKRHELEKHGDAVEQRPPTQDEAGGCRGRSRRRGSSTQMFDANCTAGKSALRNLKNAYACAC